MRRATLRDVSRMAGVSRMTVTRVFIRPEQVLPATRARVLEAIAALGYVPDRAAGSLSTRRSGFVGVILPVLSNSNFAALAEGLTEGLRTAGYEMLIGYTAYSVEEEERQLRTMLARRPEALVLTANAHSEPARRLAEQAQIPVIEIAGLPRRPIGSTIGFSNHGVGFAAGTYLHDLGLRRLAALGPVHESVRSDTRGEERLAGFEDALRAAGLSTDLVLRSARIPASFDEGASAMAELLEIAPDVEGVFAISDLLAVGALMECRRRGMAVPADISLVGFGNFEIGRHMLPTLTTIDVDFTGLGRRAADLIQELIADRDIDARRCIDVGFALLERGTTRAPIALASCGSQALV
ncbi:LacI family DNA-binding transcriptional regulator [Acidisoma cladoniae]|jgi:LacI family gluconate utilization system Gnt-I transcriptional repressor|uniref:LacI family DNA-binding transcriptional regulator n=1 Tax=Acidisoma cladoniae TaxID=3040935 RepID=UPI00254CCDD5|nr:LacI family DNA-binding transcriptional regulator [Acidisoma sp. PAMC 29798]